MDLLSDLASTQSLLVIVVGLVLAFFIVKFVVKTLIRIILLVLVLAGALYLLWHFNIDLPPEIENTIESIDKTIKNY